MPHSDTTLPESAIARIASDEGSGTILDDTERILPSTRVEPEKKCLTFAQSKLLMFNERGNVSAMKDEVTVPKIAFMLIFASLPKAVTVS